jgi:hypothetical protein
VWLLFKHRRNAEDFEFFMKSSRREPGPSLR